MLIQRVQRFIEAHHLLQKDGGVLLVALSGGADSVCLLLMLRKLGYQVEAVHCNFHLRGEESNRDEQFVIQLCEANAVKLHLTHFDTKFYAELHKVSIAMLILNNCDMICLLRLSAWPIIRMILLKLF